VVIADRMFHDQAKPMGSIFLADGKEHGHEVKENGSVFLSVRGKMVDLLPV
jgi:hypothetical protein